MGEGQLRRWQTDSLRESDGLRMAQMCDELRRKRGGNVNSTNDGYAANSRDPTSSSSASASNQQGGHVNISGASGDRGRGGGSGNTHGDVTRSVDYKRASA